MRKVVVDTSPIKNKDHKVRGVGSYINGLEKHLKSTNDLEITFSADWQSQKPDLLHIPYFDPFRITIPKSTKKTIVTIHDLIPLLFPDHFPSGIKGRLKWEIQKRRLKNVDAVVTDSHASKKDILKFSDIPDSKIHVVPLAADKNFRKLNNPRSKIQDLISKHKIPKDFVLYVGDATWNKNLPTLVKAAEMKNIPLVMVGSAIENKNYDRTNSWNKNLVEAQKLISESDNVISLGYVSSDELVALYNSANVFAFPSRYEGFGLPVLEAMQCGTPVVTTKISSIQEVAGGAVQYVDPDSVNDIAKGMEKVFKDKKLQVELSEKGTRQAKKFSWQKTAKDTIKVYEKVLDEE